MSAKKALQYCSVIKRIKNYNGEPTEYEELFARILEETETMSKQEKEELHKQVINELINTERSSTVIECAIKLLHNMNIQVLLPSSVTPLISIPYVLDTYSVYCLARLQEIIRKENENELNILSAAALWSCNMLPSSFLHLIARILSFPDIEKTVRKFLSSPTSSLINRINLAQSIVQTGNKHVFKYQVLELCTYIGDLDTFVSRAASILYSLCKNTYKDTEISISMCTDSNRPLSLENYLRDTYVYMNTSMQNNLLCLLQNIPVNLDKITALFPNMSFSCTTISNKLKKHITSIEEPISIFSSSIQPIQSLTLNKAYSETKDLSHLYSGSRKKCQCVEI